MTAPPPRCSRSARIPEGDHRARLATLGEAEWGELVELAAEQRAAPLVKRAADRAGPALAVPPAIGRALRHWQLFHARAMLARQQGLAAALDTLSAARMRAVVLKGVALAYRDYPEPGLRPMRDFDLLLPAEDAERAQALLLASGRFAPADGETYGIEYGHQLPALHDPASDTVVEVHHRLNARGWAQEPVLAARIAARAEPLALAGGLTALVPHPHDNFLHLVEHATLHHLFDNGPLVLADLHFAAAGGRIDWPELMAEAGELGLDRALGLVAHLARRHGATWVPAALLAAALPGDDRLAEAERALLRTDGERRGLALLRRLELRTGRPPGWRAGLRALLDPGAASLAEVAGTRPDDPRRWLAYPLWLVRRLRAYAAARRSGVAGAVASRQVRLHRWLHGEEGDARE